MGVTYDNQSAQMATDGPTPSNFEILEQALELDVDERVSYIERRCAGDDDRVARIRRMLEHNQQADEALGTTTRVVAPTNSVAAHTVSSRPAPTTDRIGPYKILQVLGEGGMGTVYLAEQTRPIRRRVALKSIRLGMNTHEVLARFEAEQQALALMNHPGIARVYEAGCVDDRPYFAMEFVPGTIITHYCDTHRLTIRQRLVLFHQICEAIQHAHHNGVIHRDVKPTNILVSCPDKRPLAKVIDFGIAKAMHVSLTDRTVHTQLGCAIGTPSYMSPEQAGGDGPVDHRTDIYSLGVLLYELLIGVHPHGADAFECGVDEIIRRIRTNTPAAPSTCWCTLTRDKRKELADTRGTRPRRILSELHGSLDRVVLKALARSRTSRFSTAAELGNAVERHVRAALKQVSSSAKPASAPPSPHAERATPAASKENLPAPVQIATRHPTRRKWSRAFFLLFAVGTAFGIAAFAFSGAFRIERILRPPREAIIAFTDFDYCLPAKSLTASVVMVPLETTCEIRSALLSPPSKSGSIPVAVADDADYLCSTIEIPTARLVEEGRYLLRIEGSDRATAHTTKGILVRRKPIPVNSLEIVPSPRTELRESKGYLDIQVPAVANGGFSLGDERLPAGRTTLSFDAVAGTRARFVPELDNYFLLDPVSFSDGCGNHDLAIFHYFVSAGSRAGASDKDENSADGISALSVNSARLENVVFQSRFRKLATTKSADELKHFAPPLYVSFESTGDPRVTLDRVETPVFRYQGRYAARLSESAAANTRQLIAIQSGDDRLEFRIVWSAWNEEPCPKCKATASVACITCVNFNQAQRSSCPDCFGTASHPCHCDKGYVRCRDDRQLSLDIDELNVVRKQFLEADRYREQVELDRSETRSLLLAARSKYASLGVFEQYEEAERDYLRGEENYSKGKYHLAQGCFEKARGMYSRYSTDALATWDEQILDLLKTEGERVRAKFASDRVAHLDSVLQRLELEFEHECACAARVSRAPDDDRTIRLEVASGPNSFDPLGAAATLQLSEKLLNPDVPHEALADRLAVKISGEDPVMLTRESIRVLRQSTDPAELLFPSPQSMSVDPRNSGRGLTVICAAVAGLCLAAACCVQFLSGQSQGVRSSRGERPHRTA